MKESTFATIKVGSGIILMLYAAIHLLNSIVGIHSIAAADAYRVVVMGAIQQPVIGLIVPLALLAHVVTTLVAVGRRRNTTGVGWAERVQVVLGILIPLMLIGHVTGTWYARTFLGFEPSYAVYFLEENIAMLILLPVLLIFVWAHGCMGFHFLLRLKPGYARWQPIGLSVAVLWPALATFGVIAMYKEGAILRQDPEWVSMALSGFGDMRKEEYEALIEDLAGKATMAFLLLVLAVFAFRKVRAIVLKRRLSVAITYGGGQSVMVAPGTTLLEASRAAGVSHAAVCGGRGRCSTCRTRVVVGGDGLTPPDERELKLLKRVSAAPNVRLACQAKASKACKIYPLLQSGKPEDGFERDAHLRGAFGNAHLAMVGALHGQCGVKRHIRVGLAGDREFDAIATRGRRLVRVAHRAAAIGDFEWDGEGLADRECHLALQYERSRWRRRMTRRLN